MTAIKIVKIKKRKVSASRDYRLEIFFCNFHGYTSYGNRGNSNDLHQSGIKNQKQTENLPAKTKEPTVEMKPDRKELNGKVPTRAQYTNCMTPVSKM